MQLENVQYTAKALAAGGFGLLSRFLVVLFATTMPPAPSAAVLAQQPPPQVSVEDALKASGADAVYYGTQMRGVSNAKAKRELNFQPRTLEWIVDTAVAHAS